MILQKDKKYKIFFSSTSSGLYGIYRGAELFENVGEVIIHIEYNNFIHSIRLAEIVSMKPLPDLWLDGTMEEMKPIFDKVWSKIVLNF